MEIEHQRRHYPRHLLLVVYVQRPCHRPRLLHCLFHTPPNGAASEGGHLHRPLRDSTGTTLWALQHRGPRIIPHPHRSDVSTRHLEHA
ncbi:hypothetical protein PVK06_047682 [Gossypium arboreum]|uniref:Uncharacterized protein n=1 Tax=Gossypium arboreum TaxID=29729 RepID=A0ABR0ME30_GOSAR|nr:hypothetical protein PVK06_047682 [Gossypium arboreum]